VIGLGIAVLGEEEVLVVQNALVLRLVLSVVIALRLILLVSTPLLPRPLKHRVQESVLGSMMGLETYSSYCQDVLALIVHVLNRLAQELLVMC
jgi:hypothetical protein